jgi:hypothetical protein
VKQYKGQADEHTDIHFKMVINRLLHLLLELVLQRKYYREKVKTTISKGKLN